MADFLVTIDVVILNLSLASPFFVADLHLPIRRAVNDDEWFWSPNQPWFRPHVVQFAAAGLACSRWAINGATCQLSLPGGRAVGFHVWRSGDIHLVSVWSDPFQGRQYRIVTYRDVLIAWQRFADQVLGFIDREAPWFAQQVRDWLARDSSAG